MFAEIDIGKATLSQQTQQSIVSELPANSIRHNQAPPKNGRDI
jgi:hypothetical protein